MHSKGEGGMRQGREDCTGDHEEPVATGLLGFDPAGDF